MNEWIPTFFEFNSCFKSNSCLISSNPVLQQPPMHCTPKWSHFRACVPYWFKMFISVGRSVFLYVPTSNVHSSNDFFSVPFSYEFSAQLLIANSITAYAPIFILSSFNSCFVSFESAFKEAVMWSTGAQFKENMTISCFFSQVNIQNIIVFSICYQVVWCWWEVVQCVRTCMARAAK